MDGQYSHVKDQLHIFWIKILIEKNQVNTLFDKGLAFFDRNEKKNKIS